MRDTFSGKVWFTIVLLLLAVVISSAQDTLAPDGTSGEIYYAPFRHTISLDGDVSDWVGIPRVTIPADYDVTSGKPAVTFAATADADFLYFVGEVVDNNIITGQHGADYWNEDSIEFYINATGDLFLPAYTDGVVQITIPPLNMDSAEPVISGVQGASAQAQVKVVKSDTGWIVEVAVPLMTDVWTIEPSHGKTIGFQVHLNGASSSNRDTKLIWSIFDKADQSYLNPSVFGKLIFYEIGRTDLPVEATPVPVEIEKAPADAPYRNANLSVEERVQDLLARMTLEEKVGQMTLIEKNSIPANFVSRYYLGGVLSGGGGYPATGNTPEEWVKMVNGYQQAALDTRLGIPIIYGVDAVHGHNNLQDATIFPHQIGLGATRDADLVERICGATATEMIATGIYWNYSPVVAVPHDIRWGRTYEGYSENTDLVTGLSVACVRGLQGETLGGPNSVLATPKHFIGDGGTTWGTSTTNNYMIDQGDMLVDEATLREVYLPPYQAVVDNGALSIMTSFSSWNGTKMHAQDFLMNDVLKGELGFRGFIVSDWQAIDQIPGDYYSDVVTSVNAGMDMNMVPYDYQGFINTLTEAVENGDVPMERIDDAVSRILTVKFELGLFEHPFADESLIGTIGSAEHRAIAREAVAKSVVLLQNNNNTLPLAKDAPVIFVGGVADDLGMQSGGWTLDWQGKVGNQNTGTTILEAIQDAVSAGTTVYYDLNGNYPDANDTNGNPIIADVGIAVVGEAPYAEGLGDSDKLVLTAGHKRLINRMRERTKTLVVVLLSGRPIVITNELTVTDAFVAAWLPGTEGNGVTDVLFGDVPFTGKLPYTWPRAMEQLPFDFANLPAEGCDAPLFPYGYGLDTSTTQTLTLEACE